jgi:hypothetical protein
MGPTLATALVVDPASSDRRALAFFKAISRDNDDVRVVARAKFPVTENSARTCRIARSWANPIHYFCFRLKPAKLNAPMSPSGSVTVVKRKSVRSPLSDATKCNVPLLRMVAPVLSNSDPMHFPPA